MLRARLKYLIELDDITIRSFKEVTGYSENQWQDWFKRGSRRAVPGVQQLKRLCEVFDWSIDYIWWAEGPVRRSEVVLNAGTTEALELARKNHEMLKEVLELIDK